MSVARIVRRFGQRVTTYRKEPAGVGVHGQQLVTWRPLCSDQPFMVQGGSGQVSNRAWSDRSTMESPGESTEGGGYLGVAASGIGLRPGDGVLIERSPDASEVGMRFIVLPGAKDWGRRGGWQGRLQLTDEDFGA